MLKRENNLLAELTMIKQYGIKPNFSELAKKYGKDRHTVRKYWEAGGKFDKKRSPKGSKYDAYKSLIEEKMAVPNMTIAALFFYLKGEAEGFDGTYEGLKSYIRANGIGTPAGAGAAHPRFETGPGEQLQVDWKEGLRMSLKSGESVEFNVFSATLGYSRMHMFEFSYAKGEEDFLRCLIRVLGRIGGMPREVLTDNMSAVVSCDGKAKRKHARILQFERDFGLKIRLCRVRSPETKGKVESSNRFVNWLLPYDGSLENAAGIAGVLASIEAAANASSNPETGMPPIALFAGEKETLRPLPPRRLLDAYASESYREKVPPTMLVRVRGNLYSVPRSAVGRAVVSVVADGYVYIADARSGEAIAQHRLSDRRVNYSEEHYKEALAGSVPDDDIEEMAKANLRRMAAL